MSAIIGKDATQSNQGACVLKSIFITSEDGGTSNIQVFNYGDVNAAPVLVVKNPQAVTNQYFFNDLPFPSGLTIVPSADVQSFVVEYG